MKLGSIALAIAVMGIVAAPRLAFAQGKGSGGGKEKPPDEVVMKGGETKKGEVVKETPKLCLLKVGDRKPQEIDWKEIQSINYGGTPDQMMPSTVMSAEALVDRGDYNRGAREAEDAVRDCSSERQRNLFLPRAKLALARAKSRSGSFDEAAKTAEEVVKEAAESRYAPAAMLEEAIALAQKGDESVEKLQKDAEGKGDDYVLVGGAPAIEEIDLAVAAYYEKKDKTLEAKTLYSKHEGSERPAIRERSSLGRARVAIKEKQFDSAKGIFKRLAAEAKDPDAVAGALVGLGDAAMQEAETAKDKGAAYREALQLYLKAAVLAVPMGSGPRDNHENSLRQAGACAEKILDTLPAGKGAESKEERARKFFADYARKIYEELVRLYPTAKDAAQIRDKALKLKSRATGEQPEKK